MRCHSVGNQSGLYCTMKGAEMLKRNALRVIIMMCVLIFAGVAMGQGNVQKYFNDAACKVKATTDPSQKREILSSKLQDMSRALDIVRRSSLVSKADRAGIDRVKVALQEKQDELTGTNGYARVPDDKLNAFSDYVVQDMEQADRVIVIGGVTALLIVIIIILIVR
jgi:hypothetical protein